MSKETCKDCLHCSIDGDEVLCSGMPWHYPFGGSDVVTLDKEACKHFLKQKKPTVFDRITVSPKVLAEKSVYAHECCRIPDGATSPFIDEIFWFDDEKGGTWDERFDSAWEKAIAATVAKLNEENE